MKNEPKSAADGDVQVVEPNGMPDRIGRYEIKQELGRGGMAVVYLAHDPTIPRDVAVKVIADEIFNNPETLEHFRREVRFIALLEHRAIVPVYDYGVHKGKPYLVMRYMQGGSLYTRLRRQGKNLALREISEILKQVVSALEKAHENGIIHRDIKPGNVLFDNESVAHLSDFGIARQQSGDSPLTKAVGTPEYMAPEQWTGERLDVRTDVYQLGVMLFELLTGQRPYIGSDSQELMEQHINLHIPSAYAINPQLPLESDEVLAKAMAKDPHDRHASPSALATGLYRAFGEEKINRFQIRKELSNTHSSVVYKANDPQTGQDIALKILTHRLINDLTYQQRFRSEADLIKALIHPAIVTVHDVGKYEERPYIAMQLIEGSTLSCRLQEEGTLSLDEVSFIANHLANAIDTAHSRGIIHRDIRPSNVLINKEGELFLSDFGTPYITRQTEAILYNSNTASKSYPYRTPEQWKGEVVDAKTDIYQFGVMIFEMLTGQLPFYADDSIALMDKHLDEPTPSAHEVNPDIPPNIDPILAKAMAKVPSERFTKASELVTALNEARRQFELLSDYEEGRVLYRKDQWQEAIKAFERVTGIQEDYKDVQSYLKRAREHKKNSEIFDKGEYELKEGFWQNAIYYFNQIKGYRDADVLRAKAERNIELNKLYQQGLSEYQQKNWIAAKENFNKIDRVDPTYERIDELLTVIEIKIADIYNQGKAKYDRNNWNEAIACLEHIAGDQEADNLLQLAKENKQLQELGELYEKGTAAFEAGDWDQAKVRFEQVQKIQPNFREVDELVTKVATKIREANSLTRRLRKHLLTPEGIGLNLAILSIVLAIVFDFLGIGINTFSPATITTPTTIQIPALLSLENCLQTADASLQMSDSPNDSRKIRENETIMLAPGETADFQITVASASCTNLEQYLTFYWRSAQQNKELGEGIEVSYTASTYFRVDALIVVARVVDSDFEKSFNFPIEISSQ